MAMWRAFASAGFQIRRIWLGSHRVVPLFLENAKPSLQRSPTECPLEYARPSHRVQSFAGNRGLVCKRPSTSLWRAQKLDRGQWLIVRNVRENDYRPQNPKKCFTGVPLTRSTTRRLFSESENCHEASLVSPRKRGAPYLNSRGLLPEQKHDNCAGEESRSAYEDAA